MRPKAPRTWRREGFSTCASVRRPRWGFPPRATGLGILESPSIFGWYKRLRVALAGGCVFVLSIRTAYTLFVGKPHGNQARYRFSWSGPATRRRPHRRRATRADGPKPTSPAFMMNRAHGHSNNQIRGARLLRSIYRPSGRERRRPPRKYEVHTTTDLSFSGSLRSQRGRKCKIPDLPRF